jgi:hypothetical protein
MLFTPESINISLLCFRKQISYFPELPLKKLATMDCLYSSIFFKKEIGSIKALAKCKLVHGHFTLPSAMQEFEKRGCEIKLSDLKTIIFNTISPIFKNVEPSVIGFSFCNQTSKERYWLQHYPEHLRQDEGKENGFLGLMHQSGFSEMHSLVGYGEIYPTFDIETAKLYCDLFNSSMKLDLQNLPNFSQIRSGVDINQAAYSSIFKSNLIAGELSYLISSSILSDLGDECDELLEDQVRILPYKDYLQKVEGCIDKGYFADLVEETIINSLWQIKKKYRLLGNKHFSSSIYIESFSSSMILQLSIPSRADYLAEELGDKNLIEDYIQALTKDCLEYAGRSFNKVFP